MSHSLPIGTRTLLQTPSRNQVDRIASGTYKHFGIEIGIVKYPQQFRKKEMPTWSSSLYEETDDEEELNVKSSIFAVILFEIHLYLSASLLIHSYFSLKVLVGYIGNLKFYEHIT